MSAAVALVVRFTLKEGAEEAFDQLVAETISQIRHQEPETLLYLCHRVEGKPNQRIFYELYRDRMAFNAHEAQPYVKRFLAERLRYLAATAVELMTLDDGKGVETSR